MNTPTDMTTWRARFAPFLRGMVKGSLLAGRGMWKQGEGDQGETKAKSTSETRRVMELKDISEILKEIQCRDYTFICGELGEGFYIQVSYDEPDVDTGVNESQNGRKWYVSSHSVPSEVVQTCLKAVLTSMEHRAREHFLYNGVAIYGPHFSADQLLKFAQLVRSKEYREDKFVLWNPAKDDGAP